MHTGNSREQKRLYKIYTVVERPEGQKNIWLQIGIASENRDGSLGGTLNAFPVNGSIQIREHVPNKNENFRQYGDQPPSNGRYNGVKR